MDGQLIVNEESHARWALEITTILRYNGINNRHLGIPFIDFNHRR